MRDERIPAIARAYLDQAREDPTNPLSLYARAIEHRDRGDIEGWRQAIEAASALPHPTLSQRYHRATALLTLGDWHGWADCESRARMPGELFDRPTVFNWIEWLYPVWDGAEDLRNKTLLLLPEHGLGNNIQMFRFIGPLVEKARSVIAMVYPHFVPLMQCNFPNIDLAIYGVDKPLSFDCYLPMLALPRALGCLPRFQPLKAPGRRPRLAPRTRPVRAGLCWAGNSAHPYDDRRSMPAEFLAPLFERDDIEWHSLQVGARANDGDRYPSLRRPWPPLITFADTADLVVELDVVVTVDTAVAHLSGNLGVPTYVLLATRADSRWALGDRTLWYPDVRLVRQSRKDDWAGVVRAVQRELDDVKRDLAGGYTEPRDPNTSG